MHSTYILNIINQLIGMEKEALLKFYSPSTVIVSGASGSGKTSFVYDILKESKGMFIKPPKRIIYCYGVYQNLYDEMKSSLDNLLLINGLPSKKDLEIWSSNGEHSLIVLDDLMAKCSSSHDICDLFTVCSHHMNFSVFFLVQNLFSGGKQFRTISLNAHQFNYFTQCTSVYHFQEPTGRITSKNICEAGLS